MFGSFVYFLNCFDFGSRYQSLHKLLKILIRRAQKCQYLRLLDKHCAVPSVDRNGTKNSSCLFEVCRTFGISVRRGVLLEASFLSY